MRPLSLYFHWPFCQRICPYCAFNVHLARGGEAKAVGQGLVREVALWQQKIGARRIDTIFFGGGTPSLMPPELIHALLRAVSHPPWFLAESAEITLEANPEQVDGRLLVQWQRAGINRLSLGIQALDDKSLQQLGRRHRAEDARAALAVVRDAAMRFSFDLIYARPHQCAKAWAQELKEALALARGHLSLYQLELEEGTPFTRAAAAGKLAPLDGEQQADFYQQTAEITEAAGYPAYEVSNHARKGEACRHNLACWRGQDYLGLGPGAHGRLTLLGQRMAQANRKTPAHWLALVQGRHTGLRQPLQPLTPSERLEEKLLTGLRLAEGVALAEDEQQALSAAALMPYLCQGLVRYANGRLTATRQGWLVLDSLLAELCALLPGQEG